ncbi:DUF6879 family protein [Micromonospora coxensis]|uniref:DUF6879 family protein n=1 Tax=Micromonospora coxensis TaxID=356852 RepID=UPI003416A862
MRELLDDDAGEPMTREDYLAEFWQRFWTVDEVGFWKLERRQHFREPGYDVWEAFARGDWDESLRRLEGDRAEIEAEHRRMAEQGVRVSWVRVVEPPLSAYVQWNLHVLRVREQCGSGVRVVGHPQVAPLEASGPLPELVALGTGLMYDVLYDRSGTLDGARRHTDARLIGRCRQVIADLYAAGEPLRDYFAREVAGLPAPAGSPADGAGE